MGSMRVALFGCHGLAFSGYAGPVDIRVRTVQQLRRDEATFAPQGFFFSALVELFEIQTKDRRFDRLTSQ